MTNLLSIEASFLNLPQVKQGLQLNEVRTLQRGITNAKKKKFEQSLQLSKVVLQAFEWFQGKEAQALCNEEGITWTNEAFAQKLFGWQKSYFHKVIKAAKLEAAIVETFKVKCDELEANNGRPNRSIEGLLKFAKASQQTSEDSDGGSEESEGGQSENSVEVENRAQTIFTLTFKAVMGNISVRIDESGAVKTTNTRAEISAAIDFLRQSVINQPSIN